MAIHPIDNRYGRPEVKAIFDEESKLQRVLDVEAALVWAHAKAGNVPMPAAEIVAKKATTKIVSVQRVKQIESEINHDLMAMVKALGEHCGESGKYIHMGATSYDVVDTATTLQFRDFLDLFEPRLVELKKLFLKLAQEHKKTVCIGRTHAQHATPTTYGLKFAIYACEVDRHIQRLKEMRPRLLVGQLTGAVGTQAAMGKKAPQLQKYLMQKLDLQPVMVSNQIIQRDRHAELINYLALVAASLDKFATELRNLQRTEIGEISEMFEKGKQVGSSTMPHKRNPIYSERICGLARVIKSNVSVALENVNSWHERDLANSSSERVIIPESCILSDYILGLTIKVFTNIQFNHDRIKANLKLMKGLVNAEKVMVTLVEKGMNRQDAHEIVRKCAMKVYDSGAEFSEVLKSDKEVSKLMSSKEIGDAIDPEKYIGTAVEQVEAVVKKLR